MAPASASLGSTGIRLAVQEGFRSIEHVKRYTTNGMATDQGKTSNLNGLAIAAKAVGAPLPKVGLTTFRLPYTPVSFGSFAGVVMNSGQRGPRDAARRPRSGCAGPPRRPRRPTSRTSGILPAGTRNQISVSSHGRRLNPDSRAGRSVAQ